MCENEALKGFPGGTSSKNVLANAGDIRDASSVPGLGTSPGEENGNLLQYSCLEKSTHREVWRDRVHGVTNSQTTLSTHMAMVISKVSVEHIHIHFCLV